VIVGKSSILIGTPFLNQVVPGFSSTSMSFAQTIFSVEFLSTFTPPGPFQRDAEMKQIKSNFLKIRFPHKKTTNVRTSPLHYKQNISFGFHFMLEMHILRNQRQFKHTTLVLNVKHLEGLH